MYGANRIGWFENRDHAQVFADELGQALKVVGAIAGRRFAVPTGGRRRPPPDVRPEGGMPRLLQV